MGFSMLSAQMTPIAIDFGSSSVKVLQIGPGEKPSLLAAVAVRIPDELRENTDGKFEYFQKQIPRMLRKGNFKGRRVICSIPCAETLVQHMQISHAGGIDREDAVKMELGNMRGISPHNMVVRTYEVAEIRRDGETISEVICFAINRDAVMRYVDLLKKCKLETVGVHSEIIGMVRAFDHLQPTPGKTPVARLYVDIGWAGTKFAITHDIQLVFARTIQIGAKNLDKLLATRLGCDVATARAQRISEQVLATAAPAKTAAAVGLADEGGDDDVAEIAMSIAEELSMCLRYHGSMFAGQTIDRVIFVGGEARNTALCQHIARELRLPAQLGDPLTRFACKRGLKTPGLSLGQPQPGWAVVSGLCTAPTDL